MNPRMLIGLDELRARLAAMDDEALYQFGVDARRMTLQQANLGNPPQAAYVIRLREARAEQKRRKMMGLSFWSLAEF